MYRTNTFLMADNLESTTPPSEATIQRLAVAIELASKKPWTLIWRSFLQGFMTALGATIGSALFFIILVWIFQRLGGIDLFRPEIQKLQNLIIPAKFQQDLGSTSTMKSFLEDNNLTLRT
jgi:hypothetical protein